MSSLLDQAQISVDGIYAILDEKIATSREKRQALLESFVVFYNSLDAEQRSEVAPMIKRILKSSNNSRGKRGEKGKNRNKHS